MRIFTCLCILFLLSACGMQRMQTDTESVAAHYGIDYAAVLAKAHKKDPGAIRQLCLLSNAKILDAASAQGHATCIGGLLRGIGDQAFGTVFRELSPEIREAVTQDLIYAWGFDPPELDNLDDLVRNYPRTFPVRPDWTMPLPKADPVKEE